MKKIVLAFILVMIALKVNSQWNYSLTFWPLWNGGSYGSFDDAVFSSLDTGMYSSSYFITPSQGYNHMLIETSNHGNTWNNPFTPNGRGVKLYYSPPQTFYYLFYPYFAPVTELYKTTDFGATWTSIVYLVSPFAFCSPDSSTFFATSGGNLIRSINSSLSYVFTFNTFRTGDIFFTDSLNGFLAVSDNLTSTVCHGILKSNSGGSSWSNSFHDSLFKINKLFFLSPAKGFAVGDSGKVIKTVDSGGTWQYININQNKKLNDVLFLNDTLGYVAGNSGLIMQTFNGGLSWQQQILSPPDTGNVSKIMKVASNAVYALVRPQQWDTACLYITYPFMGTGTFEIINNYNRLNIYSNPNKGTCNVTIPDEFKHEKKLTLQIFDNTGKMLQQAKVKMQQEKIKVNLEEEAKGVYNVTLSNGKKSYNGKIVFE